MGVATVECVMTTELSAAAAALKPEPMTDNEFLAQMCELLIMNHDLSITGLANRALLIAKRYKGE
jgi:hypothetical protein